MDATDEPAAPPAALRQAVGSIVATCVGLLIVLLFALEEPISLMGFAALGVLLFVAALTVPASIRLYLLPIGALSVLLGQFSPAMDSADPWVASLMALAFFLTVYRGERRGWELHRPALIAGLLLLAPLVALPVTVISVQSWAGVYKVLVLGAGLFFSLRRLVPRDRSHVLLWVFPLVGAVAAIQLLLKTQGLGAMLFARLEMRNFYLHLPWGQSNFISAVLELCMCGTLLLAIVDRRRSVGIVLLVASILMLQGVLMSFSRAGAVSLFAFAAVLSIGLGGRKGVAAVLATTGVLLTALLTPGGQVLLQRFSDPSEYGSWAVRVILWQQSAARFLAHPWTGIGLNQGRYQNDLMGGDAAHNFMLDAAMEQGVLGPIALVVLFSAVTRLILHLPRPAGARSPRTVRVFALALLAQVLVHSTAEPVLLGVPILVPMVYFFAWLCLQGETAPA